jgi:hypothetical protein
MEEKEFNSVLNKIVSNDTLFSECVTRVASADYETVTKWLQWTSPTEQKIETFIGLFIWVQHNFTTPNAMYPIEEYNLCNGPVNHNF